MLLSEAYKIYGKVLNESPDKGGTSVEDLELDAEQVVSYSDLMKELLSNIAQKIPEKKWECSPNPDVVRVGNLFVTGRKTWGDDEKYLEIRAADSFEDIRGWRSDMYMTPQQLRKYIIDLPVDMVKKYSEMFRGGIGNCSSFDKYVKHYKDSPETAKKREKLYIASANKKLFKIIVSGITYYEKEQSVFFVWRYIGADTEYVNRTYVRAKPFRYCYHASSDDSVRSMGSIASVMFEELPVEMQQYIYIRLKKISGL